MALALLVALYPEYANENGRRFWPVAWLGVIFVYTMVWSYIRVVDEQKFVRWVAWQVVGDIVAYSVLHVLTRNPSGGVIFLCLLPMLIAIEFFTLRGVGVTLMLISVGFVGSLIGMFYLAQPGVDALGVIRMSFPRVGLFFVVTLAYLFAHRLAVHEHKLSWAFDWRRGKYDLLLGDKLSAILKVTWSVVNLEKEAALKQIMQAIGEVMGCQVGTLRSAQRLDDDIDLRLTTAYGCSSEMEKRIQHISTKNDGYSWLVQCFKANRDNPVMIISDVTQNQRGRARFPEFVNQYGLRSMLAMRLDGDRNQTLGVASFYRSTIRPFTAEEQELGRIMAHLLTLTLQHFDLREQTNQQTQELETTLLTLRELGEKLIGIKSLQELLDLVAKTIKEKMNVDVATVFLMEGNVLHRRAIWGRGFDNSWFSEESYEIGQGFTGAVIEERRTLRTNNLREHRALRREPFERYHAKLVNGANHQIAVPLVGQRRTVGVLRVLNKLDSQGRLAADGFTEQDERRFETICHVVGIAIENIAPLEKAYQFIDDLAQMQDSANRFAPLLDTREILEKLVTRDKVFGADFVDVIWVEGRNDNGEARLRSSVSGIPGAKPLHERARPGGVTRTVIETGQYKFTHDVRDGGDHSPILIEQAIRSYAAVPLLTKTQKVVGAIVFYSRVPGTFDERMPLLEDYAKRVAFAAENARAFEYERRARERAQAMSQVTQAMNSARNPDEVLQVIVNQGANVIGAEGAGIVLFNSNKTSGKLQARFPAVSESISGEFEVPLNNVAIQEIIRSKKAIAVEDVATDARIESIRYVLQSWAVRSILIVPLIVKDEVIGTLGFDSVSETRVFSQDEIEFCERVATQAAIMIDNARLYEDAVIQADRLRSYFNNMGSKLLTNTDKDGLFKFIVHSTAEFLSAEDCSLYLTNPEGDELELVASSLLPLEIFGRKTTTISDAPGSGLTAYVAATGGILRFVGDEFRHHSSWEGTFTEHLKYFDSKKCRSLLILPIRSLNGVTMGVIKVENKLGKDAEDGFTDLDAELLTIHARGATTNIEQLRHMLRVKTDATQAERKRLQGELHDTLNFLHAGVMLKAEATSTWLEKGDFDRVAAGLDQVLRASHFSYAELNHILQDLRDPVLTRDGLVSALRQYISLTTANELIDFRPLHTKRFDAAIEHNLYRIAQGAISNAIKHAGLKSRKDGKILVELRQDDRGLVLRVADNGKGMAQANPPTFGIKRMKELAEEINATLKIETVASVGTTLTVIVMS